MTVLGKAKAVRTPETTWGSAAARASVSSRGDGDLTAGAGTASAGVVGRGSHQLNQTGTVTAYVGALRASTMQPSPHPSSRKRPVGSLSGPGDKCD